MRDKLYIIIESAGHEESFECEWVCKSESRVIITNRYILSVLCRPEQEILLLQWRAFVVVGKCRRDKRRGSV